MNNFKHFLHNIHLQYKQKIIVFKIPDYSYHGNRNCQKTVLLCSKEILRKMNFAQGKCEIDTFQTGFVIQVLLITLTTRSV